MALDPGFVYANYAEACLWVGIGIVALVKRTGKVSVALALALFAFGVSDIVETRTGAWYQPWWLLVWKAACVFTITGCVVSIYRSRRRDGAGQ
jgi:hypothetical protein